MVIRTIFIACVCVAQVLRSIGYKTIPVDKDVLLEPRTGVIPNVAGRVIDSESFCF